MIPPAPIRTPMLDQGAAVSPTWARWFNLVMTGTKGDSGDKGDKGDSGDKGDPSTVPGPMGPTGVTGADSTVPGPQGEKGDQGDPGSGGDPYFPQEISEDLTVPNGYTMITGDLVIDAGVTLAVESTAELIALQTEVDVTPQTVPGPMGPTGVTGADSTVPGPQGEKGDQGDPGSGGDPYFPQEISEDLTVPNGYTMITGDLVIDAGVTLAVESTAELIALQTEVDVTPQTVAFTHDDTKSIAPYKKIIVVTCDNWSASILRILPSALAVGTRIIFEVHNTGGASIYIYDGYGNLFSVGASGNSNYWMEFYQDTNHVWCGPVPTLVS